MAVRLSNTLVTSLVYALMTLACVVHHGRCALPKCTKVDDCACKLDDGRRIDIRSLGYQGDKAPRFNFTPDPLNNWQYAFNPCYDFSNTYCSNVIACQKNAYEEFGLGSASSAVWSDDGSQYTITYSDGTRTTIVDLLCSTSSTVPTLVVKGQTDTSQDKYYFSLISNCACPGQCGTSPPAPADTLSLGSILCIIFSVLVVAYFLGGICFMKFVRGADGKEVIPNVEFWSGLPGDIKEGVKFTTGLCKKDSKYEDLGS